MNKKYLVLLVTVFLLASCGGDTEESSETNTETPIEVTSEFPIQAESNQETPAEDTTSEEEVPSEETPVETSNEVSDDLPQGSTEVDVPAETEPEPQGEEETLSIKERILLQQKQKAEAEASSKQTPEDDTPEEETTTAVETPETEEAPQEPIAPVEEDPAVSQPAPEEEVEPIAESKVLELAQTYRSPGGPEKVIFNIDVSGDQIENVSVTTIESSNVGDKYIAEFSSWINNAVVGKSLSEAGNIGTVGGASLTTGAFTTAVKSQ